MGQSDKGNKVEIEEIGKYLKFALESKDNECTKLACGIVSDLSESLGEQMSDYLEDFVPCLQMILQDETLDRRIKLPALHALGDLCIYSGEPFIQKYLNSTLNFLNIAARTSTQTTQYQNDPDTLEFLKELRIEIIDNYVTLLMACSDSNQLSYILPHVETIYMFIEETMKIEDAEARSKEAHDINLLRMIIGLIGDMATNFASNATVKEKSTQGFIEQSIIILQQQDEESQNQANYSLNAINSMKA